MRLTNSRIDEFGSRMRTTLKLSIVLLVVLVAVSACNKKQTPVLAPVAPPPVTAPPSITIAKPPAPPPTRVDDALPIPPQPIADDGITNRTLDDLNRNSPLKPVFFAVDSAELDQAGRAVATENANLLKKYTNWVVTVE